MYQNTDFGRIDLFKLLRYVTSYSVKFCECVLCFRAAEFKCAVFSLSKSATAWKSMYVHCTGLLDAKPVWLAIN